MIHNIANYWFNVQVGGGQTVNQAFVFHLHSTVASITLGVTPISGHMIMQSVPHLHCAGSHPIPETHVCEEHVLGTSYPSQLSYHFGIGFARRLASSYQVCVCFCVCCVGGRAGCCRAGGGQAALAADKFGLAVVKQGLVPLSGCVCVCVLSLSRSLLAGIPQMVPDASRIFQIVCGSCQMPCRFDTGLKC